MSTDESAQLAEQPSASPSRVLEIIFAGACVAIATGYLVLATGIDLRRAAAPGQIDARFWPLMLGTLAVAVSVILLVIAITRPVPTRDDVDRIQPGGIVRVAATAVLTILYVAAWSVSSVIAFGYRIEIFPLTTAVYMVLLMLLYGQRRWLGLIIYPVALTAFIYVLFGMLLRVPL